MKTIVLFTSLFLCTSLQISAQFNKKTGNDELLSKIKQTDGLVALWDFKEKEGHARKASPSSTSAQYFAHKRVATGPTEIG